MNDAVATQEPVAPTKPPEWEWETALGAVKLSVDLVRRYFCAKATEQEIMHFMAVCRYHRLNPWLREAYIVKYQDGEPAQIVMGKWAHARKAEEHPQYNGDEGGIIIQTPEGKIERRVGTFYLEPEKLVGGWAKVYRKDRPERTEVREVRLADWLRPGPYWKSSPAHMIAKVAMAQARHEAFPTEYAGLLSEEEAQAGPRALAADFGQPLSVAEAATVEPPPTEPEPPAPEPGADPAAPSPEEQAAIRQAEHAEAAAAQALPPPQKIDRGMIWTAVLKRSKAQRTSANAVLVALTGKGNMAELSDADVLALAKKLEG